MEGSPQHPTDLGDLAKKFEIKTRDSSQEIQARIRREEAEAAHQRYRDKVILWAVLFLVVLASVACLGVVVVPGSAPENVKWATTLLTTIVAGGVGYMTGKGSK